MCIYVYICIDVVYTCINTNVSVTTTYKLIFKCLYKLVSNYNKAIPTSCHYAQFIPMNLPFLNFDFFQISCMKVSLQIHFIASKAMFCSSCYSHCFFFLSINNKYFYSSYSYQELLLYLFKTLSLYYNTIYLFIFNSLKF